MLEVFGKHVGAHDIQEGRQVLWVVSEAGEGTTRLWHQSVMCIFTNNKVVALTTLRLVTIHSVGLTGGESLNEPGMTGRANMRGNQ